MLRFRFLKSARQARFDSGLTLRARFVMSLMVMLSAQGVAFAGGQSGIVGDAPSKTVTTLALSASTATSGTAVSLTATVVDGSGAKVHPGIVTFCDATAVHCLNTARIGTAQLNASGQAVLKLTPAIGSHSYIAIFSGMTGDAASTSAVQKLSVTGKYPSTLTLSSTGTVPNYTLKATLAGIGSLTGTPTGSLLFQDTSNANYTLATAAPGGVLSAASMVPAASWSALGSAPEGVAVGDFNGDGKVDLAVACASGVTILLGNGDGTFTTGTTLAAGAMPMAIAAGDFNSDGKLDFAVTDYVSATVSIFLGDGTGGFVSTSFATAPNPNSIAVADFNDDGNLDLVVTSYSTNTAEVLLNNGAGSFTPASTTISLPAVPSSVVVGDFNGDGNMDVAITDIGTATAQGVDLSVMLGDGTGNFIQASGSPVDVGRLPSNAVVGDFNNDGVLDIAVASANDNVVRIFKGNGNGTFTALAPTTGIAVGGFPDAIAVGDFNGDGIADLSVTNPKNATVGGTQSVLIGKGDGTFAAAVPYTVGNNGYATVAADFNGDGYSDIATPVSGTSNQVAVLLAQISRTQTATVGPLSVPGAAIAHLVDAMYPGDSIFSAATSNTVSLTGSPIATTLTVTPSLTTSTYGQQVVLTAILSPSALGGYTTDGEPIYFQSNGKTIGSANPTLSGGIAVLNVTTLGFGVNNITASFHADANFKASSGSTSVTVGRATPAINWAPVTTLQYGTMVGTVETATSPVAGAFSYSLASTTVLAVGGPYTLTATFTPTDTVDYVGASATVTLNVTPATPVITWPTPAPVTYGTQLSGVQLDATVSSTTIVPLTGSYNVYGIFAGSAAVTNGGFDGGGNAYDGDSLGRTITWNGVTYPLGPVGAPDAVSNITINLPQGYFASLNMLGALVNNAPSANTFTVTYTDGSTTTVTQGLSDWVYPLNFAGESNVVCNISRNTTSGSQDTHSTCVFGYQIALDSTKVVKSVTMPATRNVAMLAMGLTTTNVQGSLVYTPAAGTTPAIGIDTLSVNFTPNNPGNYTAASDSVQLTVTQAATYIQWPAPAAISYGTPLSATQLDAQAYTAVGVTQVPLSAYYRVNAMFADGTAFSTTGFNNGGSAYSSNLLGSSISWNGMTFPLGPTGVPDAVTSTTIALPAGNFTTLSIVGAGASAQTGQTFTVHYSDNSTTTTQLSMSSWTQSSSYAGETIVSTTAYRNTSSGGQSTGSTYIYGYQIPLDGTKTVVSVDLPANRSVVLFGMALSGANSAQPIPDGSGTYTYSPPAGTILAPGTHTLSVVFTPSVSQYASATGSTQIVVNPQGLVVTAVDESAPYGTALAPYTYTITGFVNGDTQASVVTGKPTLTTTPATPTAVNSYPIVVGKGTLATSANYSFTFVNGTATITKATPVISWAPPANIPYGTALSATQLDATVTGINGVSLQGAGNMVYTPAAGTVLSASSQPQTLSVTFTPNDTTDYTPVTATVPITVTTGAVTVTWPTPAAITYGTKLSTTQLDATASVAGNFTYSPAAGTLLSASSQPQALTATFTPTSGNYAPITTTVYLMVNQAAPVISWTPPASIPYGTALSATQLDAAVTGVDGKTLPGATTYSPAAGVVPDVTTKSLTVTFTPTDSTDYTTATLTVPFAVTATSPTLTWATPAPITYGTVLTVAQLDAVKPAGIDGTLVYTPAAGALLPASSQPQTLSVVFTPTSSNYAPASATVMLVVNQAAPVISWTPPASIPYGTALSATQLDAAVTGVDGKTLPGATTYSPAAGVVPDVTTKSLTVTFTPTDSTDYTTATLTVPFAVTATSPTLTWATPAPITYGTVLSVAQLDAVKPTGIDGVLTYTPAAGALLPASSQPQTLSVVFTPTSSNYAPSTATVMLMVNKATPVISWTPPASVPYGTALGATQLDASVAGVDGKTLPGATTYSPAAGTVPDVNTKSLTVTFTPTDSTDYTTATLTVPFAVTATSPTLTWATPAPITYGTVLSVAQLDAVKPTGIDGVLTYTPAAGALLPASSQPQTLSVVFTPTSSNYAPSTATVMLMVNKATPVISWTPPASIPYGTALSATQLDAAVTGVDGKTLPGATTYSPAAGVVPDVNTKSLTVTFTPTDSTDYTTATLTVPFSVTATSPTLTWATPAPITYGTVLSVAQLDAVKPAGIDGTLVYTPAAGALLSASSQPQTLSVTFTPTSSNYAPSTATVMLVVNKATPVISWTPPASIPYGTALSATQLDAAVTGVDGKTLPGATTYSPAAGVVPDVNTKSLTVTFTPTDSTDYTTATLTVPFSVTATSPTLTWATPAPITYGTVLSTTQLDAVKPTGIDGVLTYTPAAGALLPASSQPQTLSVVFTPTSSNYAPSTATVMLMVNKATPVISWTPPASIPYGTALSATQLDAAVTGVDGKTLPGATTYSPAAGVVPDVNTKSLTVTFTPTDSTDYTNATLTVPFSVTATSPTLTWATPAPITYGTVLSVAQLDAVKPTGIDGVLTYTPAAGALLSASSQPQTLSVVFTPTSSNYAPSTATVTLMVNKATPVISWTPPASVPYGTALSATQLDASVAGVDGKTLPGATTYSPAAGVVPDVNTKSLTVTFTPTDSTDYTNATLTVPFSVTATSPTLTWATPAPITYGTVLSTTQLDAVKPTGIDGVLTYTPAAGALLPASSQPQTLSVVFTPTSSNYAPASATVMLVVNKATPVISWTPPASVSYGTALGAAQLNASITGVDGKSLPGTTVYEPAAGAIPDVNTKSLTVTFTPTDSTDYTPASLTVPFSVTASSPTVTWATPAPITYGTVLSVAQLDAVKPTGIDGVLTYTPAAGTVLSAGLQQTLSVTFTPTSANYAPVTVTVNINVLPATPSITWANPLPIVYGTLLTDQQLDASVSNGLLGAIKGAMSYTPGLGALLQAGTHSLTATFTPSDTNYSAISASVQLTVKQATPVITWPTPASISYGTALGSAQLDAIVSASAGGASITGDFVYAPSAGTVLAAGQQQLTVTFTPTDATDYTTATGSVMLSVTSDALGVGANNFTRLYGVANPAFTGTVTGTKNGDVFTESFTTSATITSDPGTYPIVPVAAGSDLNDYTVSVQDGTLTITKAPAVLSLTTSTTTIALGLNVNLTANVVSTTSGTPTGTVQFLSNGTVIGTANLSSGVATLATTALPVGANTITALYSGDADFTSAGVSASSGAISVNVTPLDFTFQVTSSPTVEGIYGTTRTYTLHVAPTGWEYPGTVNFAATQSGPFFSKYSFSPATVAQNAGGTDITFTVETQKLAMDERLTKVSRIAFGLFLLPLLGWRRSKKAGTKLRRAVLHGVLLLAALGAAGAMTGCGGTYYDHVYPMTVTATSNGIQHTVSLQFHIDQSSQ